MTSKPWTKVYIDMRLGTGIVDLEWYRIVLAEHELSICTEAHIRRVFDRALVNRNKPTGMGLWLEHRNDGRTAYYLSPISVTTEPGLVHQLGAVRSTQPSPGARLIAGNAPQRADPRFRPALEAGDE